MWNKCFGTMDRYQIAEPARHKLFGSDRSPPAPDLVTRFARDEASRMQRPDTHCETLCFHQSVGDAAQPFAIERALKMLGGRVLHLLHLWEQLKHQVPFVFHVFKRVAPLETTSKTLFCMRCKLFKKQSEKSASKRAVLCTKCAIRRTSSDCFGHDSNSNSGIVWTRCCRRALSVQRGVSRPQLFNFVVC